MTYHPPLKKQVMLATEETKTTAVWKDNEGAYWDSRITCEHASVQKLLLRHRLNTNPSALVSVLNKEPDAKAWLLAQLQPEAAAPATSDLTQEQVIEQVWEAALAYWDEVMDKRLSNSLSYASKVKEVVQQYGVAQLIRGIGRHFTLPVAPVEQAQQPVNTYEAILQAATAVLMHFYTEPKLQALANQLEKQGYQLIKKPTTT